MAPAGIAPAVLKALSVLPVTGSGSRSLLSIERAGAGGARIPGGFRMRKWIVGVVAGLSFGVVMASVAQAAPLPVIYNGALGFAHASPTASPPGSDNWSCRPTAAHPRPVILVHGTFEDMSDNWQALSPLLYDNGYCVFALNYGSFAGSGLVGIDATGPIEDSAAQLASFVSRVRSATGARQVDIVGHSQGGMMPRYYMKFLNGATNVHTLVGLAPSNHGTTLDGLFTLAGYFPGSSAALAACPACAEQQAGSSFMTKLNSGGDTVAGVDYTVIESENDEVVTPYTSAFLTGPNVTDITLQNQCRLDQGEHLSMAYDHIADADVLTALDPQHPVKAACTPVGPVVGG
jgi:triacylglycerol esterase/lipase EstA (alpha/beta hydrolase family)